MIIDAETRLKRDLERWYKLKYHAVQDALVNDQYRFKVCPAGRRSGKTEKAKRYVAKKLNTDFGRSENFFIAAPTFNQVKKMYWNDMKQLCLTSIQSRKPSESELIIFSDTGNTLHFIGLDNPERIEGTYWAGGIVDEIANVKATAWAENIKPALDTFNPQRPDYRAWCWLIGVPEGLNHYYDICEAAKHDPNWGYYWWPSSDILPEDVIAEAKRNLSAKQFKQEYEGSFETAAGRIYEDYSKENTTDSVILEHEQLLYSCDFNYTPMSHSIGVRREGAYYLLDEIVLESAVPLNAIMEFCERYKEHKNKHLIIYGDPAGQAGEKHSQQSSYTQMTEYLTAQGWSWERRIRRKAPSIVDRQNSVRAFICSASGDRRFFVNPVKAPYTHKGCATTQLKEGSAFQEDNKDPYQHITTAIGYMIEYENPVGEIIGNLDILNL